MKLESSLKTTSDMELSASTNPIAERLGQGTQVGASDTDSNERRSSERDTCSTTMVEGPKQKRNVAGLEKTRIQLSLGNSCVW